MVPSEPDAGTASEAVPELQPAAPAAASAPEPAVADEPSEPEPEVPPRPASRASLTDAKETLIADDGLVACPSGFRQGFGEIRHKLVKRHRLIVQSEARLTPTAWGAIETRWREYKRHESQAMLEIYYPAVNAILEAKEARGEWEEVPSPRMIEDPVERRAAEKRLAETKKPRVPGEIFVTGGGTKGMIRIVRIDPKLDDRIVTYQAAMAAEVDRVLAEVRILLDPFLVPISNAKGGVKK